MSTVRIFIDRGVSQSCYG